jgi:ABC-type transport system substrate-binding protein
VEEWVNGDHMTFVRNPDFYEKGKPEISKITVQIVPDESVRKTMLLNGDADLECTTEPMINDLKDKPNVQVSES